MTSFEYTETDTVLTVTVTDVKCSDTFGVAAYHYDAPQAGWDPQYQQYYISSTFGRTCAAGYAVLDITKPTEGCNFQIDVFTGMPITEFDGTYPNYSKDGRLIVADHQEFECASTPTPSTTTSTPTPTTTSSVPATTSTVETTTTTSTPSTTSSTVPVVTTWETTPLPTPEYVTEISVADPTTTTAASLPVTGADSADIGLFGSCLLGLGLSFIIIAKKFGVRW